VRRLTKGYLGEVCLGSHMRTPVRPFWGFVFLCASASLREEGFLGFKVSKNPCIAQRRRGAGKPTFCSGFAG